MCSRIPIRRAFADLAQKELLRRRTHSARRLEAQGSASRALEELVVADALRIAPALRIYDERSGPARGRASKVETFDIRNELHVDR